MDNIKFKIIPFLTVFKTIGTTQFKSFNKTKTVLRWYNFDCKERKAFFSCVFENREPFVFIRIDVIDKAEKGLYYIDICNQYEDFININVIIDDAINSYIKTDMFYFNFNKVCSTISFNNKRECNFVINILKSMKNVEMVQENINKMLKQLYGL